ncbi:hypothetical protein OG760_36315 [Streptomyces sp. NBC_00963]|uniref:hypothetical protein n=1 Tax=unclassified Streptomyces TaxID=2593676 RepID=UPI0022532A24|nr:hypothetical protein [Streptomyces sp. NBC_01306]MCX4729308.1 hypothetical protein [Streptomyces sp. NBC_01306]WSX46714.1 hypothetical protein OG760_36315 [Streptomyces sp. NBC_00963]
MSTVEFLKEWRVLGFGKHPEIGAVVQARLRKAGLAADIMVLPDDESGDAELAARLGKAEYDGVVIGSFISGQDPNLPPTEQTTYWFNRVLNVIHAHAPAARIILVRNPDDALAAIARVLG